MTVPPPQGITVAFAAVPSWVAELILPVAFGVIALRYLAYGLGHARQLLVGKSAQ